MQYLQPYVQDLHLYIQIYNYTFRFIATYVYNYPEYLVVSGYKVVFFTVVPKSNVSVRVMVNNLHKVLFK